MARRGAGRDLAALRRQAEVAVGVVDELRARGRLHPRVRLDAVREELRIDQREAHVAQHGVGVGLALRLAARRVEPGHRGREDDRLVARVQTVVGQDLLQEVQGQIAEARGGLGAVAGAAPRLRTLGHGLLRRAAARGDDGDGRVDGEPRGLVEVAQHAEQHVAPE